MTPFSQSLTAAAIIIFGGFITPYANPSLPKTASTHDDQNQSHNVLAWLWGENKNEELTKENERIKNTDIVLAMNYLTASLVKISTYNDRVILTQEYDTIINNINLSKIHDQEAIDQITSLMDILTEFKLNEAEMKFIRKTYDDNLITAMYEAKAEKFTPDSSSTMPTDSKEAVTALFGVIAGQIMQTGSENYHYQKNVGKYRSEMDRSLWEIDREKADKLNKVRQTFITSLWSILHKHDIPDGKRLTENQFSRYFEILKDDKKDVQYRNLLRIEEEFTEFPPYWYFRGIAAQQNNQAEDALMAFQKFEKADHEFFRNNNILSSGLINHIELLDEQADSEMIKSLLKRISEESPYDGGKNLFVATKLAQLEMYDSALERVKINLYYYLFVSKSKRLYGLISSQTGDANSFSDFAQQMLNDDTIRVQDILFMIGPKSNRLVLQDLIPKLVGIGIEFRQTMLPLGKDELIVTIPIKWVLDDLESFNVEATFADTSLDPVKTEISDDGDHVNALFKTSIPVSDILNSSKPIDLEVNLEHVSGNYLLSYSLRSETRVVDPGMWDNLLQSAESSFGQLSQETKKLVVGFSESSSPGDNEQADAIESEKDNGNTESKGVEKKFIEISLVRIKANSGFCFQLGDQGWEIEKCD